MDRTKDRSGELKSVIISVVGLFLVAVGDVVFFMVTGRGIPCLIRMVTGRLCPGCGMTHAFAALLHGDIAAAWTYNPLSITVIPVLGVYLLYRLIKTIRTGEDKFRAWEIILLLILFIPTVGFWIVRNLS